MKKTLVVLAIVVFSVISGCAGHNNVSQRRDNYTGNTFMDLKKAASFSDGEEAIDIDLRAIVPPLSSTDHVYLWVIVKVRSGNNFIINGGALRFLVDREKTISLRRFYHTAKEIEEAFSKSAVYKIKYDDLKQIASARTIRVSIDGSMRNIEEGFTPEHINNFKKFVEYLEARYKDTSLK
jgi:hypothetical protein